MYAKLMPLNLYDWDSESGIDSIFHPVYVQARYRHLFKFFSETIYCTLLRSPIIFHRPKAHLSSIPLTKEYHMRGIPQMWHLTI